MYKGFFSENKWKNVFFGSYGLLLKVSKLIVLSDYYNELFYLKVTFISFANYRGRTYSL